MKINQAVLVLLLLLASAGTSISQELFRLDFDGEFLPDDWIATERSEWGHLLGEGGTDYFRFHPYSINDWLQSPELVLDEGDYALYFSWNEAKQDNPDNAIIRIRESNGNWQDLYTFGSGNNRAWQSDSVLLEGLTASRYALRIEYYSTGRYPSQYLNLDNIYLVKGDVISSSSEDQPEQLVRLHPNPVRSKLFYHFDRPNDGFRISNSTGQVVYENKGSDHLSAGTVDVSGWPAGMYSLEVTGYENISSSRFVVE